MVSFFFLFSMCSNCKGKLLKVLLISPHFLRVCTVDSASLLPVQSSVVHPIMSSVVAFR